MRLNARFYLPFASLLVFSIPAHAQEQKFASLGEFKLESGEVIHDCRVGYRTFGKLNADGSNAILFPTWANGTTDQLQHTIGPHTGVVDYADYFVILIDALANGVSSSPSNSAAQSRMKFPKITVRDMVNSQYQVAYWHAGAEAPQGGGWHVHGRDADVSVDGVLSRIYG
jgi:homoserine O-acetyltransferase